MATIRAFTDLEQSKKLAEILPLESADMFYVAGKGEPIFIGNKMVAYGDDDYDALGGPDVLCWSLAALLGVLPALGNKHAVFGTSIKESKWHVLYHNIDTLFLEDSGLYDNLIDACYEMILKLHELKIL